MRFSDKVVWVTGASSGIGEHLAYAFSREGARLVISARRAQALDEVAERCGGADVVPLDLGDHERLPGIAREALERVGRCDVLVNNAGVSQRAFALETDWTVDRQLMNVDYLGTVILTKAVLPGMVERGDGHVVAVSSVAGRIGVPKRTGYSAAKFALHGFFDALRAEVSAHGVRVTMAVPGFVATSVSLNALSGDGSLHGKMDELTRKGLDPAYVAERIVDAVAKGRREVVIAGLRERAAIWLARFAPGLLARMMRTARVT